MTQTIQATGTVTDGNTIHLDRPLSFEEARVNLTIEPIVHTVEPRMTMMEAVAKIRASQKERGHVPITTEEIDSFFSNREFDDIE